MNSALAQSFLQDLKYGARFLRLSPGFAATATVSLAIGIAANTSIFTLVDQILLRMLPVHNPRELVQFRMEGGRIGSQSGDGIHTFSYPLYIAFRDYNTVFSGLTGQYADRASLMSGDRSEIVNLDLVAGNFFDVLGVRAHIGRVLTADDTRVPNASPVVVLQYNFWSTRFMGRADVLGSTIHLNGAPFTVVGVAAPEFEGTNSGLLTQVWAPVTMKSALSPTAKGDLEDERFAWFYLFARLKPGVSIEQAQSAVRVLYDQRKQNEVKGEFFLKFPDTRDRFLRQTISLIRADRGMSWLRRGFERPLIVLQCLVGVVLLIACTNVANL
ncbi:MAG TPA: ABC transporter permease, partial [Bryobacteraceae bacterium]|nr:ABC transporter permease [Bryobacteraceae bacterium]